MHSHTSQKQTLHVFQLIRQDKVDQQNMQEKDLKVQKLAVKLSLLAYKKIVYHSMRYSSSKVYGALIANASSPNQIINAFPLFHTPILNPTFNLALDLIESNLQKNQQIVGFYEFVQLGFGDCVINRIVQTCANLKNMKVLRVWVDQQKNMSMALLGYELSYPSFSQIKKDLIQGQHHYIIDFDAHLEQVQLDFRNNYVKAQAEVYKIAQ